MKKQTIIAIVIAVILVLAIIIGVVVGNNQKSKGESSTIETASQMKAMFKSIYNKLGDELPDLETAKIDVSDALTVKDYTGLQSNENVETLVVSEPTMSSQAYSAVAVKVKAGANVEKMKQEMLDNIDMAKWICVSASNLYITNSGNTIFMVMSDEDWAKPVYEAFKEYVKNYDPEDKQVKLKIEHIERVSQLAKQMAEKLKLDEEDIKLAELIGLLHDIARFEQYTKYHTFKDAESIDHGDLGAEILKKDIKKYIETDEYDELIQLAVKSHNKYKIQEGLTQKQEMFAKIIRDADKLDILYESTCMFWKGRENLVEESKITPEIIEEFKRNEPVDIRYRKTPVDEIVSVVAFIFDINYGTSFEILKRENYINKIIDRYNMIDKNTKEQLEYIKNIASEYIEQKIK